MKTLVIVPILMLYFAVGICFAQLPDWTRVMQLNTYGSQTLNVLAADENNVYMTGNITGPITIEKNSYTAIGSKDLIIIKSNLAGTTQWIKTFDAKISGAIIPSAMKVDGNGNIFITGSFSGTTTIGLSTIASDNSLNSFVAKFDSNGNGLWATAFLSSGTGSSKIALDDNGNCYLLSRTRDLIKVSSAGIILWSQTYPDRTLQAVAVYGTNLYVGGGLQGTTIFGGITLNSTQGLYNKGFIVKANLDGNYTNSIVLQGAPSGDGTTVCDIIADKSGSLLLTGGCNTKDLIIGNITVSNQQLSINTFIAKCNSNLVFDWVKMSSSQNNFQREMLNFRLFLDNSNNIYQFGLIYSPFSYNNAWIYPNGGQFLAKFDASGNLTNSYPLQNTSANRTIVTPSGKIASNSGDFPYGYLIFGLFSNGMALEWQKYSSGIQSGFAEIRYVKYDSQGNTYLQSRVRGYCNYFGTVINTNNYLTVISKHDITGKLLWLQQISDVSPDLFGSAFTLDEDNNVLIAGLFNKTLYIGSTLLYSSNTGNEGYVAKFSSTGFFLWASKMDLNSNVSSYITVASDKAGNVLVSGIVQPASYLVKFDAMGNQLWSKIFPMESYYLSLVSTDANNNIYLTSEIHLSDNSGSATIGSIPLTQTYNDGSTVLIKLNPDGNALWAKTYGGVTGASYSDGWACAIKTDDTGNTYLWGWCLNNAIFGSTTLTNPLGNPYSYYLTKINTEGNVVWANAVYEKKNGFNYGNLLDLDKNGNVYVGGHFNGTISISGNTFQPEGLNDFFVVKYSNDGQYKWIKTVPADATTFNSLSVFDENVLAFGGNAGKNSTLGNFGLSKKSGSNCLVANLGNLPPYLNVSSDKFNFPSTGGNTNSFQIASNINWNIVNDQSWLSIDKLSGTGNSTVTLTAKENPVNLRRSTILKISGTGVKTQLLTVTQDSSAMAPHFAPVWTGNGFDHMNINIYSAKLDGVDLEIGDEIGIFDGTICVGVGKLTGALSQASTLDIVVSKNDESGNGYTAGNAISFKLYDSSKTLELANVTAVYSTGNPDWSTDGKFAVGVTSFAALTGATKVSQDIAMNIGWNIISAYVVPANLDLKAIFQTLIDAGSLKKVMDEAGKTIENFGAFGGWKNNIGNLNSAKGYKVNVTAASTLSLEGLPVQLPLNIPLALGWNIISYPCSSAQDAKALVQPLIDSGQLKKVMDEAGKTIENFGAFGGWKNNIGNFLPGKGYKVNVTAGCSLSIASSANKAGAIVPEVLEATNFSKVYVGNGTDHFNVHLVDLASSGLQAGDQIGIFDGKFCVGAATIGLDQIISGNISIPASCNDETTGKVNGFTVGHPVTLQLFRENQVYPLSPAKVGGSEAFEKNGSLFLKVTASDLPAAKISAGADQIKCYPNPFVDQLTIEIRLTEPKKLEVSIYDLSGKLVRRLFKGDAGTSETVIWDGTNGNGAKMGSGTYILKANEMIEKVALKK